jgi:tRNA A37 threonylcarbamoyladenosine dehydratase
MYHSGCGINHTWKLSKKSFDFIIVAMDETEMKSTLIDSYTFIC